MAEIYAKQIMSSHGRCLFALMAAGAMCLGLAACSSTARQQTPAQRTSMTPAQAEAEIHRRVNGYRRSRGLPPLAQDRKMIQEAREHSRWMARRNKMSHRGSGKRFSELQREPTRLRSFAENVALNFGHGNPAQVAVDGWIRSPGHHKNMIRREYQLTGIGVTTAKDGTWYFTQLFGHR